MTKRFTHEQQRAIDTTHCDLIVTAGAGSGKTTTMIERALQLVLAGTPVMRITMLTFTDAAAAEMKEKMRARLIRAAQEETDADKRAYWVEQIDSLPYAPISTIHSYCYSLCREYFAQIPLSPSVRILEEELQTELQNKSFELLLQQLSGDEAFEKMRFAVNLRKDDELKQLVLELYEAMVVQPDRNRWLDGILRSMYQCAFDDMPAAKLLVADITATAQALCARLRDILAKIAPDDKTGHKSAMLALNRCQHFEYAASVRDLLLAYEGAKTETGRVDPRNSPYADAIRSCHGQYNTLVLDPVASLVANCGTYEQMVARHRQNEPFVQSLLQLTAQFDAVYTAQKAEFGGVDFADLERYAMQVLRDEGIRQEVVSRSDYVFVDEYQDVNYLQNVLIRAITPPDRLFAVGDSKQCIYRFRDAEPQIFLDAVQRLRRQNQAVDFTYNFRSDNGVLRFVNSVFEQIMTPQFGGVDYAQTDAFALRDDAPDNDVVAVSVFMGAKPPREKEEAAQGVYSVKAAMDRQEEDDNAEGLAIAQYIALHLGRTVTIKGEERVLTYSDFALLFSSRNHVRKVVPTLLRLGIPLNMRDLGGDVGLRDARILLQYAQLLDNGMQDYPLLTVMRSAFGSFSDHELSSIRLACDDRYAPFWQAVRQYATRKDALAQRVAAFLQRVQQYRFAATFTPISVLLRQLVLSGGYVDKLLAAEDGLERLAALYGFIDAQASHAYSRSLVDFCRYFRNNPLTQLAASGAQAQSDGVVLSTIHSAKGLEYPVVMVVGCGKTPAVGNKTAPVITDRVLGIGTDYYDQLTRTRGKTFMKEVLEARKRSLENEDRLRLLYVALTRAQCYLLMTGFPNKTYKDPPKISGNFYDWFLYAAAKDPTLNRYYWRPDIQQTNPLLAPQNRLVADDKLDDVLAYRYPYRQDVAVGKKYTVTQLNDTAQSGEMQLPSFLAEQEEMRAGTAYHTVFQYVDFAAQTAQDVRQEVDKLVQQQRLGAAEAAQLDCDAIARCLALPIFCQARRPGVQVMHEQRFVMQVPASYLQFRSSESVLVQGVIDLLIVDDDGITVVDFKHSRRSREALQQAYQVQLRLYCDAVQRALSRSVTRCVLVEIGRAMCVEMPVQ